MIVLGRDVGGKELYAEVPSLEMTDVVFSQLKGMDEYWKGKKGRAPNRQ